MKLQATQFRVKLFPTLERALGGEEVQVLYKGSVLRLVSEESTRLSRAKRQKALMVDPDSIIGSDPGVLSEMEIGLAASNKL